MCTRHKEALIKTDKGKQDLSKLQFTTEVFQPTYKHQREELTRPYMAGAMNMNLQTFANTDLEVSPETWFGEWSENYRAEYVRKFQELTIEQVMERRTIRIVTNANTVTSDTQGKEFVNVPSLVAEKNNIQRMNSSKDLFNR